MNVLFLTQILLDCWYQNTKRKFPNCYCNSFESKRATHSQESRITIPSLMKGALVVVNLWLQQC